MPNALLERKPNSEIDVVVILHRSVGPITVASEDVSPYFDPEIVAERVAQRRNNVTIPFAQTDKGEDVEGERLMGEELGEAERGDFAYAVLGGKAGGQGFPVSPVLAHPFAVELQTERGVLPRLPRIAHEAAELTVFDRGVAPITVLRRVVVARFPA